MVDKEYCMSSFLALRYIERPDADFSADMHHGRMAYKAPENIELVASSDEIDRALQNVFRGFQGKRLGLLLSGGMDSGILASYMRGMDAYTFRFSEGDLYKNDMERAAVYAKTYGLRLHYVDVDWDVVDRSLDGLMKSKCAPVHSIEPQIYAAAVQAKQDGIECMVIGDAADCIFGGLDQLLSRDWTVEEFAERYTFTMPSSCLREYRDMSYVFERYRVANGKIDFLKFMDEVFNVESYGSYYNAFSVAKMDYVDPYASMGMAVPLDLKRIRSGDSKYLIRELFRDKYPEMPVPDKIPMPRPVDIYFENWRGPERNEFLPGLAMDQFTGNQKWQIYCLERFLNLLDEM